MLTSYLISYIRAEVSRKSKSYHKGDWMTNYLHIMLLAVIAAIFAGVFLLLAHFIGPKRPNKIKNATYECGLPVQGKFLGKFSVKFYLVVILFLLFDLEVVFLYPWAIQQKSVSPVFWFVEGLIFAVILIVGWVYVIRKGVLDWAPKTEKSAE